MTDLEVLEYWNRDMDTVITSSSVGSKNSGKVENQIPCTSPNSKSDETYRRGYRYIQGSMRFVGFLVGDSLHNRMLDCFENEWLDTGILSPSIHIYAKSKGENLPLKQLRKPWAALEFQQDLIKIRIIRR